MSVVERQTPRKRKNLERKELLRTVREKDKAVVPKTRAKAKAVGNCGARTRSGTLCKTKAGAGTEHPGIGYCARHGGTLATHKLNSYKQEAIFMGAEMEINPFDAIMWCIRIKAGEIEWLSEQMQELDKRDWVEESIFGKQMHLFQRERTAAIELLAKMSKDAVALGIAERAVRLAESYGASIARLLKGIHDDLQLSIAQQNMWPQIVRRHLILIETTKAISGPSEPAVIEGTSRKRGS